MMTCTIGDCIAEERFDRPGVGSGWQRGGNEGETAPPRFQVAIRVRDDDTRAAVVAALAACAWMAVTGAAAASGILREWERTRPPFALLVVAIGDTGAALVARGWGGRILVRN